MLSMKLAHIRTNSYVDTYNFWKIICGIEKQGSFPSVLLLKEEILNVKEPPEGKLSFVHMNYASVDFCSWFKSWTNTG